MRAAEVLCSSSSSSSICRCRCICIRCFNYTENDKYLAELMPVRSLCKIHGTKERTNV